VVREDAAMNTKNSAIAPNASLALSLMSAATSMPRLFRIQGIMNTKVANNTGNKIVHCVKDNDWKKWTTGIIFKLLI
jgi:hypothetical protein